MVYYYKKHLLASTTTTMSPKFASMTTKSSSTTSSTTATSIRTDPTPNIGRSQSFEMLVSESPLEFDYKLAAPVETASNFQRPLETSESSFDNLLGMLTICF